MINSPGKSFSRDEIGKIINLDKERSIDVIITRLRKKIEKDPKNPKYLQTLRGEGYVLWIEQIFKKNPSKTIVLQKSTNCCCSYNYYAAYNFNSFF